MCCIRNQRLGYLPEEARHRTSNLTPSSFPSLPCRVSRISSDSIQKIDIHMNPGLASDLTTKSSLRGSWHSIQVKVWLAGLSQVKWQRAGRRSQGASAILMTSCWCWLGRARFRLLYLTHKGIGRLRHVNDELNNTDRIGK